MKKLLFFVLIVAFGFVGYIFSKRAYIRLSTMESNPPKKVFIKNYIWIEAEDAVSQNFCPEPIWNYFCSGKYALQLASDSKPASGNFYAVFEFFVQEAGDYEIWMGMTPPGAGSSNGAGYASPFLWQIDDGPIKEANSSNTIATEYYGVGGYHWVYIGTGFIDSGKHTLKIVVNKKRASGWDYYLYLDAILMVPKDAKDVVLKIKKEKIFPKSFSKKKRIDYQKPIEYLVRKARSGKREDLLNLAKAYIALYDYPKAIKVLKDLVDKYNNDIFIRYHLAFAYLWNDEQDKAIKEFKGIIDIAPKNVDVRKILGTIYAWSGRYGDAIREYRQVIRINKRDVDAYIWLANVYLWRGNVKKSKEYFKKAEKIARDDPESLYKIALLYEWTDNTKKAIQIYERIIDLNPYEIEAYKRIARIYYLNGNPEKAEQILAKAQVISQNSPEFSDISLDVLSEIKKERKKNIEEYKNRIKKNPYQLSDYKTLISFLLGDKRYKEAIYYYDIYKALNFALWIKEINRELSPYLWEYVKMYYLYREFYKRYNEINNISYEDDPSGFKKTYSILEGILKEVVKLVDEREKEYKKNIDTYIANIKKLALRYGGVIDGWRVDFSIVDDYVSVLEDNQKLKDYGYMTSGFVYGWLKSPDYGIKDLSKLCSANFNRDICKNSYSQFLSMVYGTSKVSSKGYQEFIQWKSKVDRIISSHSSNAVSYPKMKKNIKLFLKRVIEAKNLWFSYLDRGLNYGFQYAEKRINRFRLMLISSILDGGYISKAIKEIEFVHSLDPKSELGNFIMANVYRWYGRWKDAAIIYKRILTYNPSSREAKIYLRELKKHYSPRIEDRFSFHNEDIFTRMENFLTFKYPISNYLTVAVGNIFITTKDETGTLRSKFGTQEFYKSTGSATAIGGFINVSYYFPVIYSRVYGYFDMKNYKGNIDYEDNTNIKDSDINYTTFNYRLQLDFQPFKAPFTISLLYGTKDIDYLTQALRQEDRDEIKSNFISFVLNLNFSFLPFDFGENIFLYSSFEIGNYSDGNKRTSSYNQLSIQIFELPKYGISLLIGGIITFDDTAFTEYEDNPLGIKNLPYYAPSKILSYGGMVELSQERRTWEYSIGVIYMQNNYVEQPEKGVNPYVKLGIDVGNIYAKVEGYYYKSLVVPEGGEKPYSSMDLKFRLGTRIYGLFLKP